MAGTPLIISAALTTGSFLAPGSERLAAHPDAHALIVVLMVIALTISAYGAWRSAYGTVRYIPAGPALPNLRRRIHGPRDRRS
jgi:hypothetical protein